jgi:hypothetical protein
MRPGFTVADLSQEQEAAVIAGDSFWTPELDGDGAPTGSGTLSAPPPQVPDTIANWRAKAVIELHGLTTQVEAALTAMEGAPGITARAAWNGNADFARHGATVTALATTLGLTDAQLDTMFIQAAALEV